LAANVLQEIGDKGNEMHSRKGLYEGLWSSNPDSARIELERFNELKDSLYNIASAESLARYNAEFGTDWLQHENEQQKARTRKIIVFGLVLLILIAMAVWLLMRRRMKIRETALQTIINELQGSERANAPQESQPSEQPSESSEPTGADGELLSRVVAIVKSSMSQETFTIETLASEMCTTRGSLNRRIKAITGVTTQQYVLRIRLEHSRILLKEDNRMPISEIAYKCGFEDATSFSRAFRRTFNISPSQYRNQE
jgi:AraC-like DNA-binding protein